MALPPGSRTGSVCAMATRYASRLDPGVTLPFSWFADPGVFRDEQQRIFARSWQYAGVSDWVEQPGQYFTAHAGLVPVVVVRDHDGCLNGFVNICRHRATEVAQGRGKRETLQCPYHAWTYGLDGCLRAAPRSDMEPGFDRSQFGLRPVAVDSWGPFVFVNRDLDAAPLSEYLDGELEAGPRSERCSVRPSTAKTAISLRLASDLWKFSISPLNGARTSETSSPATKTARKPEP